LFVPQNTELLKLNLSNGKLGVWQLNNWTTVSLQRVTTLGRGGVLQNVNNNSAVLFEIVF
jgi:hypothetical protein